MLYLKCLLGAVSASPLYRIWGFHKRVQPLSESKYPVNLLKCLPGQLPPFSPLQNLRIWQASSRKKIIWGPSSSYFLPPYQYFLLESYKKFLGLVTVSSRSIDRFMASFQNCVIFQTPHSVFVNSLWHFIKSSWFWIISPSPRSASNSTLLFETYLGQRKCHIEDNNDDFGGDDDGGVTPQLFH